MDGNWEDEGAAPGAPNKNIMSFIEWKTVLVSVVACILLGLVSLYYLKKRQKVKLLKASPWRKMKGDFDRQTKRQLMEEIKRYKMQTGGQQGESRRPMKNILLIGQISAGKSSFVNSVQSTLLGEISGKTAAGARERSLTQSFRRYLFHESGGEPLPFALCDVPGVAPLDGLFDAAIRTAILDGKARLGFRFENQRAHEGLILMDANEEHRIHAVAITVNAETVALMEDDVWGRLQAIYYECNEREVPVVVVLTHIGKQCPHGGDVSKVFLSAKIESAVQAVAQKIGVVQNIILPVENYSSQGVTEDNMDILILMALQRILRLARDYIYQEVNPDNQPAAGQETVENVGQPSQRVTGMSPD